MKKSRKFRGAKGQHTVELTFILTTILFLLAIVHLTRLERQDQLALLAMSLENQDLCRKILNLVEIIYVRGPESKISTELPARREVRIIEGRLIEVYADIGFIEACILPTALVKDEAGNSDFTLGNRTIMIENLDGQVLIKSG
ncbi:MAG: hypothetical protein ABH950_08115 [Candidatus Altiarchaeota archaeon]